MIHKRRIRAAWPLLAAVVLAAGMQACGKADATTSIDLPPPPRDSVAHITVRAVGDLMCHAPQFEYARVGADSFDFSRCYAEVAPFLQGADFTIGNVETVFAGASRKYTGYPTFNTPEDYLGAIKAVGFDFLVTANNHSLDRGESGALRTLSVLDSMGFAHTGTFRSPADRDSIRIVDIKGLRMAILNYTYGTNGIPVPAGKPWIINLNDTTLIDRDVAAARALKPDLVTVFFHWGLEYMHEPSDSQRYICQRAVAAGADIVLGAHPHVVQPLETFKTAPTATLDSGFVIWSMGNFLSNQSNRYTDAGIILEFKLAKDFVKDSVWLEDISYLPTWVFRGQHPKQRIHTILPAEKAMRDSAFSYLAADSRLKAKQALEDTDKYMNLYRKVRRVTVAEALGDSLGE